MILVVILACLGAAEGLNIAPQVYLNPPSYVYILGRSSMLLALRLRCRLSCPVLAWSVSLWPLSVPPWAPVASVGCPIFTAEVPGKSSSFPADLAMQPGNTVSRLTSHSGCMETAPWLRPARPSPALLGLNYPCAKYHL